MLAKLVSYLPPECALDYIRRAALISWVQAGHSVTVWSHRPQPNLPAGVEGADAALLLDVRAVPETDQHLIADRMRWRILAQCPGAVFLPPDFVLFGAMPLPQDGYLFAWQDGQYIGPGPVALPAGSVELTALNALADDPAPIPPWAQGEQRAMLEQAAAAGTPVAAGHLPWGLLGAQGLTYMLRESGRIAAALPVTVFHPLPYAQRDMLLRRKCKLEDLRSPDTVAMPLYPDDTLRQIAHTLSGLPRYWCPLGETLRLTHVEPRHHMPVGVVLQTDDTRWQVSDPAPTPPPEAQPTAPFPIAPAPPTGERICILTCMKNEGPFILEWIAHHRSIGVTDFIVYTNDCTDGTDELLELLVARGIVTARYDNPFVRGMPGMSNPQFTAFEDAQKRPEMAEMDWLLPMDLDEFVDVHVGDGTLAALFAAVPEADTISLVWRLFGNDGRRTYEDGLVTEQMHSAAIPFCKKPYQALGFKTLHRNDGRWEMVGVHRPKQINADFAESMNWVSSSGKQMLPEYERHGWRITKRTAGYDLVSLNHYAVRDAESYLVKRDRGRVNHVSEDQGLAYWFRMNHNAVEERSFDRNLGRLRAEYDRLMADPQLAQQHHACVAAHRAKIAMLRQREDMTVLHAAITGPVMETLTRISSLFGNRIFEGGPACLPDAVLEWAQSWDQTTPPPEAFRNPEAIAPEHADPNRLLPTGSPLSFGWSPPEPQVVVQHAQNPDGTLPALSAPLPRRRVTLVAMMHNEGPFILEWVAWHRAVGVTDFLIYTQDCTDPTNAMLDRLADMGMLTRVETPIKQGSKQKPQRAALNDAVDHPLVRDADWVIVANVDEFMNIHVGDGTIDALCSAAGEPNVISMTVRLFGNGGLHAYCDRPVTEQFTACAPLSIANPPLDWGLKTMLHRTAPFAKLGAHRPLELDKERLEEVRWVNGSGQVVPEPLVTGNGWRATKRTTGYDLVTLNQYVLRSAESFLVACEGISDVDQGVHYWTHRNYSTKSDTRATDFARLRMGPELAALMADAELAQLHARAVDWHRARIAHLRADPDYGALYEAITDPELEDAINLAEAI